MEIELETLSSQRQKSTQIGVFLPCLPSFTVWGGEPQNKQFQRFHPSQPRDLCHGMLTKMSSAEPLDNQPVGTSANMEMSVGERTALHGFFLVGCKHLCRIRGTDSDRGSPI